MTTYKLFFRERMKWKMLFALLPLFLAMNSYAQSERLNNYLSEVPHKEVIVYDEDQNLRATSNDVIELPHDQFLVLKFWSTPSTGFQWDLTNYNADVVEVIDLPLHEACSEPDVPGAAVWQCVILKPNSRGKTKLEFAYQRPWDTEKSREDHFAINVKTKGEARTPWSYENARLTTRQLSAKDYGVKSLPSYFDWRDQNAVTPVRDQGSCGSCWAFGSTAGFEAKIQMKHGTMPNLAEQYLVSCNDDGFSCAGGWWAHDLWAQYIPPGQDGAGAVYETDFEYEAMDLDCKLVTHHEQIEGWAYTDDVPDGSRPTKLHDPTVAQIKQKLHQWGPIPTALCIDNWGSYTGGVLEGSSSQYTNHIVLITGWDDSNQCWIIKNSWGSDWGEDGYIRIRYGSHLSGQYSTYLKYDKTNPRIVYQGSQFYEAIPNDGTIRKPITAKLLDAGNGFAVSNQLLTAGTHYIVNNLPAGLNLEVRTIGNDKIQFDLVGTAVNHLDNNDAVFDVELLDPVFADYTAADIEAASYSFDIDFFNPYQIVYEDIEDYTVSASNEWEFFRLANGQEYGLWYSFYYDPYPTKVMTFFLETYTKKAICNTPGFAEGDRMLTPLNYGAIIDNNVNYFVTGGSYGDQHRITNSKYSAWNGRTAYVGIQFSMYGGTCFGWMRIQVASDGSSVKILDYAYNEKPFAPIKAGYTSYEAIKPIAEFNAEPLTTYVGQEVFFKDRSERDPDSWNWTFTGATPATSTEINPIVTYAEPGVYPAQLQVTNAGGSDVMLKQNYITVYPAVAPEVAFSADELVPLGASVQFTDESVNMPDTWLWEFEGGTPATSTEQHPTVVFGTAGIHKVKLTASNAFGSNTLEKEGYIQVQVPAGGYCSASNDMPDNFYIEGVNLANLHSSSDNGDNGYEDHLSEYAALDLGESYPIDVEVHNDHWTYNALGIWIDWNKDGDFDDNGETIHTMHGTHEYASTVNVPEDAPEGLTRMRVRIHYSKNPYPCGTDTYQGQVEDYTIVVGHTEVVVDTEPPSIPQNLNAEVDGQIISLNWSAATDNVGVASYKVYMDGDELIQTSATAYTTSALLPETTYTFKVKALDASNNESGFSQEVSITTEEEIIIIPPVEYCEAYNANDNSFYITNVRLANLNHSSTKSGSGYQDFTGQTASLNAGDSYQISVGVLNDHWPYNAVGVWADWNRDGDFDDESETLFSMNGQGVYAATFTVPAWVNVNDTRMRIRIHYDKDPFPCGYDSYQGEVEDYTLLINGGNINDQQPPSTPVNLEGSVQQQTVSLTWDASTDDTGIAKYKVYMENEVVQEVTTTSCVIENLAPSTTYSFNVQAVDMVGKLSELSGGIRLTTEDNTVSYCNAQGLQGPEHINNVTFVDLNHSSGSGHYADNTHLTAHLQSGQYQLLEVGMGDYYSGDKVAAWFDWNGDGDFEDANEHYDLIIHTDELAYQWIMAPEDAVSRKVGMRIRIYYYSTYNVPCGDCSYGEVEDYSVQVQGGNGQRTNASIGKIDVADDFKYQLYPNPSEGQFTFGMDLKESAETKFMVYDMYGGMVYSDSRYLMKGKCSEDLHLQVPPGIYTLRIINTSMDKRISLIVK